MTQPPQGRDEARRKNAALARDLAGLHDELAIVTDVMPVMVSYVGADQRYQFNNEAYETWFGHRRENIIGRHIREILGEGAYVSIRPSVERALAGETVTFEAELPYRDGGLRAVRAQYLPHHAPDGQVMGFFALVEDISNRGLFATLLDALGDGVLVLNRRGVIVACNPSAERMTGMPASLLIGSPSTALFDKKRELPPGSLHLHHPVFEVARGDGSRGWVSVMSEPLKRDEQGPIYGTLLCITDMTDKKLAEDSFTDALSMRDLIAQASNDAIWDWDLETNRIWWSEGLRSQFGHISEAATDRDWWLSRIHPEDRQRVKASWISVFKGRSRVWLREFRFRKADGDYAAVVCRGHIVHAENGRAIRMFGAMQDVSQQKAVEDELQQSEELSRAVLSSLSARIGVLDRQGVIIEVNDDWRRFERDERPTTEAHCLLGDDYVAERAGLGRSGEAAAAEAERGIRAVLSGARRHADLEYRVETPAGARWFLMHVEPLRTDRGGAVVSHIEVTNRRAAEEAEIRRIAAELSEQAKTDLLNVVSHELRTPLAVIRGHVTTVIEYGERMTPERRAKSLQSADIAALQLERLVADLLTMGKLDAGLIRLDRQPESLESILREAVEGVEAISEQEIEIDLPDKPIVIDVDRSRMIQVFYNLLDNACKYKSPGTPIRVEVTRDDHGMATVLVENMSAGIRSGEVENLFERFYRTNQGIKANSRGAGLGLSISRGIVEAHDGRIWARTKKGLFQVYLTLPALVAGEVLV